MDHSHVLVTKVEKYNHIDSDIQRTAPTLRRPLERMNEQTAIHRITLRKNEHHRIVSGHPWVFSNEIQTISGTPKAGEVVEVREAGGKVLGTGFFNPHSLIACRILSRAGEQVDRGFFERRIQSAIDLRTTLYPESDTYRIVHGESDFLPGLVVDRYGEYLAIQTLAFGMDSRKEMVCDILESLLQPRGIVERNESPLRSLELLELRKGVLRGTLDATTVVEHGLRYRVDILEGQKTGLFLDQRENRLAVRKFSAGAAVLDCFCNDGGFAMNAAAGGASSVLGVDVSADAVARATMNASLNELNNISFQHGDVFEKLAEFQLKGMKFDVVILDPPSFTKNRKTVPAAKAGYKDLHGKALRVLSKRGILITTSCSHHIEPEVFLEIVDSSARKCGRTIQQLAWSGAAPDHPVLPGVPETRYLKCGTFLVD
jgi:23S rRNA (cytosine1962-C5)-methyltransferase